MPGWLVAYLLRAALDMRVFEKCQSIRADLVAVRSIVVVVSRGKLHRSVSFSQSHSQPRDFLDVRQHEQDFSSARFICTHASAARILSLHLSAAEIVDSF